MSKLTKALTAAAGNAGSDPLYAEDVFSTYLYDGNGSSITVNNGIDLAGEGGVVWTKSRTDTNLHYLQSSETTGYLSSNNTNAIAGGNYLNFASDGYTFPYDFAGWNGSGRDYASWTFRKAEKFFDVVTYTGNGTAGRTVAHNLGSVPAVMIVKSTTNGAYGWRVYHQSLGNTDYLRLNETNAAAATAGMWNNTTPTDSEFTLGGASVTNGNGESFVAYLFASDAGGFGDDGSENIIKCGSFTTDSNAKFFANTGFEPQWVLVKRSDGTSAWNLLDTMRGLLSEGTAGGKYLRPNTSGAEGNLSSTDSEYINATGFGGNGGGVTGSANATFIYMAIRRPMKTPTAGTEVFNGVLTSSDSSTTTGFPVDIGFPVDLAWVKYTTLAAGAFWMQRLTGLTANPQPGQGKLAPPNTTAQANSGELWGADNMTGYRIYGHTYQRICYGFKRATGFMDMVAYTGNGASSHAITHNLGVSPELIITKRRDTTGDWRTATNFSASAYSLYKVNEVDPATNINYAAYGMYAAKPTSTTFTVGSGANVNASGGTFISYLFGTVAGVSKVGSVVHSGTTDVDCGFSAGARFVMAKRADQNGDWYYWDTMRGIVAGNDDYLLLNSDAVEVTNTDYIDPLSSGFTLTSSFTAGTYIFLAIA